VAVRFEGRPEKFSARIMAAVMGPLMKGVARKCLKQDMEALKSHLESGEGAAAAGTRRPQPV
jgi:hypothetical protein